jgi:putative oxidoreductase
MHAAMLILRVVVGLLFIGHGTQKLFGWFGGPGLDGATGFMRALGYRPARPHAVAGGLSEAVGGSLLVLGLATPLAAAAIIGVMVNAIATVHGTKGLWVTQGGYEYNAVLIAACLAIATGGAGAWSLDEAFGWDLHGAGWGLVALVVGFAGAAITLATRRPEEATAGAEADLRAEEQAEERPAHQHRRAA